MITASGGVHWTIELPNQFGVEVLNQPLSFTAGKFADGSVQGLVYHQIVEGESFNFRVSVTCLNVYDGNRAKLGGLITKSNDSVQGRGRFAWVPGVRQRRGRRRPARPIEPHRFRRRGSDEAFCNSPNLPRFGPWDVAGNVHVRA